MNERASIGAGGGGGGIGLGERRPARRDAAPLRPRRRPAAPPGAGRALHRLPGREVQQPAGHGQDQGRSAARPRDVDRQAGAHQQHVAAPRTSWPRCSGPRLTADTGEWGTYAWTPVPAAASPGMRVAGGTDEVHAQHRRRAGARPPQGARHRLEEPVPRPARQALSTSWRTSNEGEPAAMPRRIARGGMPVHGRWSMNTHVRRWIAVGPMPASAVLWRGHG